MPAVDSMTETFAVEDGHLLRKVIPRRGEPHEHRCPHDAFEQIAHAAEELGEQGFTLESLLKYERRAGRVERGVLEVRYRRNYAAVPGVHLDAMTELHALAENG